MSETTQQQPDALADIRAIVAEQRAIAVELALESQHRCNRVIELARVILEDADQVPLDAEGRRIRTCAEIILEAGEVLTADAERIEIACNQIHRALVSGSTEAGRA